jgi:toxin ParE1/3/4
VKPLSVRWSALAEEDLLELYRWLAAEAGANFAFAYTGPIRTHMDGFRTFPERGTQREDLGPGLRTTIYRRRTVIIYRVIDDAVEVVRLHHAGRNLTVES